MFIENRFGYGVIFLITPITVHNPIPLIFNTRIYCPKYVISSHIKP